MLLGQDMLTSQVKCCMPRHATRPLASFANEEPDQTGAPERWHQQLGYLTIEYLYLISQVLVTGGWY